MAIIKRKSTKKATKKGKKKATTKKGKVTPKEPSKMGRPLHPIDWNQVDAMCKIQCTQNEIASVIGCHRDTLDDRCVAEHGITFSKYFKEKSRVGKASLRHTQFKVAKEGSVPMLIHLGKNILDQTDKKELSGSLDLKKPASALTDDELAKIIEDGEAGNNKDKG
ncbi:hypothetical protein KAR91_53790 [Candidatus Pacearchaeota archaeon]|nr:hypothetical protein [Candidatus Pacearchaeota archaeon]